MLRFPRSAFLNADIFDFVSVWKDFVRAVTLEGMQSGSKISITKILHIDLNSSKAVLRI